jgi:predicted amidohydrolase YtcJ
MPVPGRETESSTAPWWRPRRSARSGRLALTVVTRPGFVAARGDRYLADVDPAEHDNLWRCGFLLAAGVGVAAGSDAPGRPVAGNGHRGRSNH